MTRHILNIFFIFIFSTQVICQNTEPLHLTKYGQNEGLNSYNIRKIIQDKYGFIWVATQDALYSFTGVQFSNYTKFSALEKKLCGIDIREIIEDTSSNLLWVLPGEYGLNAIDLETHEVIKTIPIPMSGPDQWNLSMVLKPNEVWIGTSTGIKVLNLLANEFLDLEKPVMISTRDIDFEVRTMIADENNNIWAFYSGYGISIYNGSTKRLMKTITNKTLNIGKGTSVFKFKSALLHSKGNILIGSTAGLRMIQYDKLYNCIPNNEPCLYNKFLNNSSIEFIARNSSEIYVSGNKNLYKLDNSLRAYARIEEDNISYLGNWLSSVQGICFDKSKNMWLACQQGLGFVDNRPAPFLSYYFDDKNNERLEHVRSIFPLSNNDLMIGLQNGLAYISATTKKFDISDKRHAYFHVFQDPFNNIQVSRDDGMFIYRNRKLYPVASIFPEWKPVASCTYNSHLFIGDSLVILGTENTRGILLWNYKNHTVSNISQESAPAALGANIVNKIYSDSRGQLWVLSDNIITLLTDNFSKARIIKLYEDSTKNNLGLYFDIIEEEGGYWIASYGNGLIKMDSTLKILKIYTTREGLSDNGVYQLYKEQNGILITTNNGLSFFGFQNEKFKNYYQYDGLHSNNFEEVSGMTKENKVYAGGTKGFTIISPIYLSNNLNAPILYFTNIHVEAKSKNIDTINLLLNKFTIQPNWLNTTISFAGINYSNPKRTSYKYLIREINENWVSLNTQNFITLIGLSPGTYHLQVQAFNEDGVPSEIKELALIFLPKWYQTWWFKLLLVVMAIGCVYGLYYIRISQLKKEQQIRSKLASDLHDDLGSTMNSVKVYANLALMEKQQEKYLFKIKESTQEAITGIRDIIWVLDDSKDSIEHLLSRISLFASPLCEANGILYKQEITDEARDHKLGQEERRNLYMMLKEALNNAIKYADATQIVIDISVKRGKPAIQIKDNGKGFDLSTASDGNGLKNMNRRAKEIKYLIQIESAPGSGTAISFQKI